ncbi:hypothetical protein AVEN_220113-1, partial [Araneus ventricosus]
NVLGLVQGCGPIAGRSCLSKTVSNEDLGKVFSLVAIAESILPIVTLIIFSQIFNAFLDIFAGTPYILLAAVIIIPFSVFINSRRSAPMVTQSIVNKERNYIFPKKIHPDVRNRLSPASVERTV